MAMPKGAVFSAEHKAKIAEARRSREQEPIKSDETKARHSEAAFRVWEKRREKYGPSGRR